jgi:hypothetical protein
VHYAPGGAFEKALARSKISMGQDVDQLFENECKKPRVIKKKKLSEAGMIKI